MLAPSTMVWSTPFLTMPASNGEPFMNDWPTITWSQPTMLPSASTPPRTLVHEDRAVAAALDVVLARPQHLDRPLVLRGLEHLGRLRRHVARGRCAAAEAAAGKQRIDLDLLGLEAEHRRGDALVDGLDLRAEVHLDAAVVGAMDDAVVGLHRRVRQIGEHVRRFDHLGGAGQRRVGVAVVARDRALLVSRASTYSLTIWSLLRASVPLSSHVILSASRPFFAAQ